MVSSAARDERKTRRRGEAGSRKRQPRTSLRESTARSNGTAPELTRPLPTLSPSIVDGNKLDITAASPAIYVGSPGATASVFASLFDLDVLPALEPLRNEHPLRYLHRCADDLAKQYATSITVTFADAETLDPYDTYDEPLNLTDALVLCISRPENGAVIEAVDFHQQLFAADRILCGNLFDHIRRATDATFHVFTPGYALDISRWLHYGDDIHGWWDDVSAQAEHEYGIDKISNSLVRKFIRENEIPTPGRFRRCIGRHHIWDETLNNRESIGKTRQRAENLPKSKLKAAVIAILDALDSLYRGQNRLERMMNKRDHSVWGTMNRTMPAPALIFETDPQRTVTELIEDQWQSVAGDSGFSPNYALAVDASRNSCKRIKSVLEIFQDAEAPMAEIVNAISPE